eukprot:scaffold30590_cov157-Isochrysis_galbana.AAC.1
MLRGAAVRGQGVNSRRPPAADDARTQLPGVAGAACSGAATRAETHNISGSVVRGLHVTAWRVDAGAATRGVMTRASAPLDTASATIAAFHILRSSFFVGPSSSERSLIFSF